MVLAGTACPHDPIRHSLTSVSEGGVGCVDCGCAHNRARALSGDCGTAAPTHRTLDENQRKQEEEQEAKARQKEFSAAIAGAQLEVRRMRRAKIDLELDIETAEVEIRRLTHRRNRHMEDNNL